MKILIITRCSRLTYLEKIHESIKNTFKSTNIDYKWTIIFDMNIIKLSAEFNRIFDTLKKCDNMNLILIYGYSNNKLYGSNLANQALSETKYDSDYVYLLDDDNCMHPDFGKKIETLFYYCNSNIIFFGQQRKTSTVIIDEKIINSENCLGMVDSAQFLLKTNVLKTLGGYENGYYIDGLTIRKFLTKFEKHFMCTNDILSYYNYYTEIDIFNEKENISVFINETKSTDE